MAEYSQMSTHLPGLQSFFRLYMYHFVFAKLATSSIRAKKEGGRIRLLGMGVVQGLRQQGVLVSFWHPGPRKILRYLKSVIL